MLYALFASILTINSCDKLDQDHAQINSPFELELDERILFPESSNGLSFTLQSINDSRCPTDVQCIVAGSAIVQFLMSDNSGAKASAKLCIGFCDHHNNKTEDIILISLGDIKYSVKLKSVNPYPNKIDSNKNKKALFIVNQ